MKKTHPSLRLLTIPTLVLLGIMLVAGCEFFDDENHEPVRIATDQESYSKSGGESINFQAINNTGVTLYQYNPPRAILEKLEDGIWKERGSWYVTTAMAGSPRAVPNGGEFNIPDFPSDDLVLIDIDSGIYRVKAFIYEREDMKRLLPLEQRVSNAFEITE